MLSYGLKCKVPRLLCRRSHTHACLSGGEEEAWEERKVILEALRESVLEDRVDEAREQYEREQAAGKK